MMINRVPCSECNNMILPQTATENDGLCAQCIKVPKELREQAREFVAQLRNGKYFRPSPTEWTSKKQPDAFFEFRKWELQPEYYSDYLDLLPIQIVKTESESETGNIFLVTSQGDQLNIGFSKKFAVCEYQNEETGEFRIAFSDQNLTEQVESNFHVAQACPCCGVETLWFPSRFHMPKALAFEFVESIVNHDILPEIHWLEPDDFSHTTRGKG